MKVKTNKTQILNHLLGQKHISQLEALGVYRCFRLSAVIHELRKEGYNILSHWFVDATGKKYKRYYLVSPHAGCAESRLQVEVGGAYG